MSEPLKGTESAALAIGRVSYTHDAMIDLIITNPAISQNAIAKHFGYSPAWVSRVFNSDAFQARLAVRKSDIIDPTIVLSMDEKLRALADQSLDILATKMALTQSAEMAFKALELSTKSLGYGARAQNVNLQQNFVVAMPDKAQDAAAWASKHAGGVLSAGQGRVPAQVVEDAKIIQPQDVAPQSPELAAMLSKAA